MPHLRTKLTEIFWRYSAKNVKKFDVGHSKITHKCLTVRKAKNWGRKITVRSLRQLNLVEKRGSNARWDDILFKWVEIRKHTINFVRIYET